MDVNLLLEVATLILTIVSLTAGAAYQTAKTKAAAVAKLLTDVIDAAQDNQVTEAEFQKIVADAKQIVEPD